MECYLDYKLGNFCMLTNVKYYINLYLITTNIHIISYFSHFKSKKMFIQYLINI